MKTRSQVLAPLTTGHGTERHKHTRGGGLTVLAQRWEGLETMTKWKFETGPGK